MKYSFNTQRLLFCFIFCFFYVFQSVAQIIVDGNFSEKNSSSISISYIGKSYDTFYRGDVLTEGNPMGFGEISSNIISIYGQYAFTDWLTGAVSLPYISVKNANEINDPIHGENSISSLQDLSLCLKAKAYSSDSEAGTFTFGAGASTSFPMTDYEAGSILSVGNGATAISGFLLLHYKLKNGLFFEAAPGFSSKSGNEVPNSFLYNAKVGFVHSLFYLDLAYGVQNSTSGINIGGEGFAGPPDLPKTEVDYNVLDLNIYVPIQAGIGASIGYGTILNGKNIGNESYYKIGVSFNL